jgi:hypothetical protein
VLLRSRTKVISIFIICESSTSWVAVREPLHRESICRVVPAMILSAHCRSRFEPDFHPLFLDREMVDAGCVDGEFAVGRKGSPTALLLSSVPPIKPNRMWFCNGPLSGAIPRPADQT